MAGLLNPAPALDAVSAELRRWCSLPFIWGKTDCGLSVIAYVERVRCRTLTDRPNYATSTGGYRLLRRAGGYVSYGSMVMEQLGCPETDNPVRGDVGLADLAGSGLTAILCLGKLWAARGDRKAVVTPASPVIAWRVTCPRP